MWDFLWRHADSLIILFVLWNINFRLNAVSRAQDHNFTELLKRGHQYCLRCESKRE